jgi:hypothetical protein
VLEVYVAARTEPALGALLAPILDRHRQAILGEAGRLFPELASRGDFSTVVDAVVYAMQGVIERRFGPDADDADRQLPFFERLAVRELESVLA